MKISFHPKLLDALPGYDKAQLGRVVSAGLTGYACVYAGVYFALTLVVFRRRAL